MPRAHVQFTGLLAAHSIRVTLESIMTKLWDVALAT